MKKFRDFRVLILSAGIALAATVSLANAAPIVPDGRTDTALTTVGNTTDISTNTITGANAFNSFTTFNVDSGKTVNLLVPGSADNLINLVSGSQTRIDGILNSLKNGQIGGNVYLLNPYGVLVGQSGRISVGSLSVITPTQDFVNDFFSAPGVPNQASVDAVLGGTTPINSTASIINKGNINATQELDLFAGSISNEGRINVGQIVNLNTDNLNLKPGSQITSNDVRINRLTNGDIVISNAQIETIKSQNLNIGNNSTIANLNITDNVSREGSLSLTAQNIDAKNISATGDVNVSVLESRLGNITSGENINLFQSGYISGTSGLQAENLKAGKDVNVRIGNIGQVGNISSGQDINLHLTSGGVVAKNLNAGRDANLRLDFGGITTGNIKAGENILLSASRSGGIGTGDLTAGYDIHGSQGLGTGNIVAGHDFTHSSLSGGLRAGSIKVGNAITIDHSNMLFPSTVTTGDLTANSDIEIFNPNGITTGNVTTKGNLIAGGKLLLDRSITNSNSITMNNIQTGENLDLRANVIKTGNINTGRELNITTKDSLQTGDIFSRNNVNIKSSDGFMPSGSITTQNIKAGGHILESAGGPIRNGNLTAERDVDLSVLADGIYTGNIKSGGNILESGGFSHGGGGKISNGNLNAKGDVNLSVTLNSINTGNITVDGDIAETAIGDITNGNLKAGGNITETSNQRSITNGDISAKGNINLSAYNANNPDTSTKINSGNIKTDGNVELIAGTIKTNDINAGGSLTARFVENNEFLGLIPSPALSIKMGNINVGKDVDLFADVISTNNILAGGNIDEKSVEDNIINGNLKANGDILLTTLTRGGSSSNGSIFTNNIEAGGYIFEDANKSITNGSLKAGDSITSLAGSSGGNTAGDIKAGTDVSLYGGRTGSINVGNVTAGERVGFSTNLGDINTGNINAGNEVRLIIFDTGTINTKDIKTTGNIYERTFAFFDPAPISGNIINGNLVAGDNIDLFAGNNIKTGNITSKGSVTAGSLLYDTLEKATSINTKNITATNNIDLAAHTVTTGKLTAGGTITVDED